MVTEVGGCVRTIVLDFAADPFLFILCSVPRVCPSSSSSLNILTRIAVLCRT